MPTFVRARVFHVFVYESPLNGIVRLTRSGLGAFESQTLKIHGKPTNGELTSKNQPNICMILCSCMDSVPFKNVQILCI